MPLEPTNTRDVATRNDRQRMSRRRLVGLSGIMLAGSVLAACSGDSSREAERGRARDASQESIVKDLQATETWNVVHGSPEATPPPEE